MKKILLSIVVVWISFTAFSQITTTPESMSGFCDGNATYLGDTLFYNSQKWYQDDTLLLGSGPFIGGLCSGSYSFVRDSSGFFGDTSYFTILSCDSMFSITLTPTNADFGICNGSALANVTGGYAPYLYSWNTGDSTSTASNVCGNSAVFVTVYDSLGCSVVDSNVVGENAQSCDSSFAVSLSILNADFGVCNGSATANVVGGNAPYTYVWNTGDSTSAASNVCGNSAVFVTVYDNLGCSVVDSNVVGENAQSCDTSFSASIIPMNADFGTCNGSALVNLNGGNAPYFYSWSTGDSLSSISGVCGNTMLYVSVFDNFGCFAGDSILLEENAQACDPNFEAIISVQKANQGLCDANASAIVIGGNGPFVYSWSNGDSTSFSSNLCGNTSISIIVTDSLGCMANASKFIGEIIPVCNSLIITTTTTNADCGLSNGQISASVSGGTAPYKYSWSTGDTTSTTNHFLKSGLYSLTVKDANGCAGQKTASVSNNSAPSITEAVTDVSCFGNDGAIDVTVSGSAPFTYKWSNGATTEDISGVDVGAYNVEVTDNGGCKVTKCISVAKNAPLTFTVNSITNTSNCTSADGAIDITVNGGTSPYLYEWPSLGSDAEDASNLSEGFYKVIATDNKLCKDSMVIAVSEVGGPTLSLDSIVEPRCMNSEGVIMTTIGVSASTTNWSNSSLGNNFSSADDIYNLPSGDYELVATDASGCTTNMAIELENTVYSQEICLVTSDTMNNNVVVWEKEVTTSIESYNIYKESSCNSGEYNFIGTHSYDSLSEFTDYNTDSSNIASYKISVNDKCGSESSMSNPNNVIRLSVFNYFGNNILVWNDYIGSPIAGYNVWRKTNNVWTKLNANPISSTYYTDSAAVGTEYAIEAPLTSSCTSFKATTYGSTRSNSEAAKTSNVLKTDFESDVFLINAGNSINFKDISNGEPTSWNWTFDGGTPNTSTVENPVITYDNEGTYDVKLVVSNANGTDSIIKTSYVMVNPNGIEENSILNVKIHPNPSEGIFNVELQSKDQKVVSLEVYNTLNQKIRTQKVLNNTTIDLSDEPSGVYIVQLISETGSYNFRIIKE